MIGFLDSSSCDDRMLRVLHVDDHASNRRLVRDILSSHGHESVEACSGAGALTLLATQHFDVVLMDINMPGMGGIEVVRLLRRSAGLARFTPVIACTSDTTRAERHYLALGFDGYVSKPFSVAGLMEAVYACAEPSFQGAVAARRVA